MGATEAEAAWAEKDREDLVKGGAGAMESEAGCDEE